MTKAERKARFDALTRLGCVVCRREYGVYTAPAIHHLKGAGYSSMGQRASDEHTVGLCQTHHQDGGHGVAYHAGPKAFEAVYGTQADLLQWTNERIRNGV